MIKNIFRILKPNYYILILAHERQNLAGHPSDGSARQLASFRSSELVHKFCS